MSIRRFAQSVLHRFGVQLVRNTRPRPRLGFEHDPNASVPASFRSELSTDNPRLVELRRRYAAVSLPMARHTWWTPEYVDKTLDLVHFRGDNAYVWQTRHTLGASGLRYYLYARDISERDSLGFLPRLGEDGAFGAWVFRFHRFGAVSRDRLDSANELGFLARHGALGDGAPLRILDIGAGYGRLAHRCHEVLPNLERYDCVDAVPESTFLCEVYLRFRECLDRTRVVAIDEISRLGDARPDLALNVHSFSEMSRE
ncbi:MAG: putative sugar O-methyltransferase, partial [Candidatus Binatia bacterium]